MGISIAEFARRDGCSRTLVQRGIAEGRLEKAPDGTLDPDQVGTGWRKGNRRGEEGPAPFLTQDPAQDIAAAVAGNQASPAARIIADHFFPPPPAADEFEDDGGTPGYRARAASIMAEAIARSGVQGLLSTTDAERLKENYLGLLRQLEYDMKSGAVVPATEVVEAVTKEYAAIRTKLLALPSELAPRLFKLKTLPQVQDVLTKGITEALSMLTMDGADA